MNRWWYEWLIRARFPRWLSTAFGGGYDPVYLVQDHEKALWTDEPREAMRAVGVRLLEAYPKCSQDLNPIETAWREVRNRLDETVPVDREPRKDFIQRLRRAVAWVNTNRAEYLQHLCTSQKERTQDVLDATPPGARTKHWAAGPRWAAAATRLGVCRNPRFGVFLRDGKSWLVARSRPAPVRFCGVAIQRTRAIARSARRVKRGTRAPLSRRPTTA